MSQEKRKIMFVLPSLRAGGAERVMSFIAQNLDASKFETQLLIIGFEKDKAYDLYDHINIIYLNKSRVSKSFFSILKAMSKYKPDVVLSSIGHLNTMMSLISPLFRKTKFIGREANVKSTRSKFSTKRNGIKKYLNKRGFRVLDAIICQSNDMFEDFKANNNIDETKFVIINNPITDNFNIKESPKDNSKVAKYVTVGTLHKRKGHARLLQLLSKLNHEFEYTIIGNGDEKENIYEMANELNLKDSINHIPFTKEVSKYLGANDVFLNGSYVEGFPNVMLESCSVGTPVVAFEAPGGINEIILEGINGYIVTSEEEYINRLNEIKGNNPFSAETVSHSVLSRYGKDIIIPKYEALFENLIQGKSLK